MVTYKYNLDDLKNAFTYAVLAKDDALQTLQDEQPSYYDSLRIQALAYITYREDDVDAEMFANVANKLFGAERWQDSEFLSDAIAHTLTETYIPSWTH